MRFIVAGSNLTFSFGGAQAATHALTVCNESIQEARTFLLTSQPVLPASAGAEVKFKSYVM